MDEVDKIISEYRPSMDVEVLHSWAVDAVEALEKQKKDIDNLKLKLTTIDNICCGANR